MRSPLADMLLPQDPRAQPALRPAGLSVLENVPLACYTRFEIGGPARILADAASEAALIEVLNAIEESGERYAIIGGGTNLVAGDQGYLGVVVRYTNAALQFSGDIFSFLRDLWRRSRLWRWNRSPERRSLSKR